MHAFHGPADLGGALDVALITEFVDAGHDLLLAVNTGVSDELRELAQEFGVDLDAQVSREQAGSEPVVHFGWVVYGDCLHARRVTLVGGAGVQGEQRCEWWGGVEWWAGDKSMGGQPGARAWAVAASQGVESCAVQLTASDCLNGAVAPVAPCWHSRGVDSLRKLLFMPHLHPPPKCHPAATPAHHQDTSVIDHFRYEATKGAAKHAAVMAGGVFDSPAVFAEPIKVGWVALHAERALCCVGTHAAGPGCCHVTAGQSPCAGQPHGVFFGSAAVKSAVALPPFTVWSLRNAPAGARAVPWHRPVAAKGHRAGALSFLGSCTAAVCLVNRICGLPAGGAMGRGLCCGRAALPALPHPRQLHVFLLSCCLSAGLPGAMGRTHHLLRQAGPAAGGCQPGGPRGRAGGPGAGGCSP